MVATGYTGTRPVGGGDITDGTVTDADIASANKDGAAATLSLRTLGAGAQQSAAGNDARIVGAARHAVAASPAAGVIAALSRGQSAVVQAISDSTGVGATSWFGLLGATLGTKYPTYNVWHRAWNAATQWYDLPTVIQAGAGGDSRITTSGSCAVRYTSATNIVGDLDVRVKVAPTSWSTGNVQGFAGKWASTGNQRSWWFALSTAGLLVLTWSADGATQIQKFSTVATGFAAGAVRWVRATLDVDNGSAQNVVTFYTSTDGSTWTQLGSAVTTAATTAIFASTAPYQLAALDSTVGSACAGDHYWVEVRDGIGGVSVVPPLAVTWDQATSASGNTVVPAGAPTLLLVNGSEGGQNIAYFDNATRRPKIASPHRQDLLLLASSHNEGVSSNQAYIAAYATWVTNLRALAALAAVPIVSMTQNPQKSPRAASEIAVHASRGQALMGWSRSQVGVHAADTYPAFTDLASQVSSDGVHPTAAGHAVWADYAYQVLFAATGV